MNELAYLQDQKWLKERNKAWKVYRNRFLDEPLHGEEEMFKHYFFTGDIDSLMKTNVELAGNSEYRKVPLDIVLELCPFQDTAMVLGNVGKFWSWVIESPKARYDYDLSNPDESFVDSFHSIFNTLHLAPNVRKELFFWLYGDIYNGARIISINTDDVFLEIKVSPNVNSLSSELIYGFIMYFFYPKDNKNFPFSYIYEDFIEYFLSLYPSVSEIYFSSIVPSRKQLRNDCGTKVKRFWYLVNRWLLSLLNGYLTDFEEEIGITEIKCNNEAAFQKLKNGIAELDMPDEFYKLEKFVLKHKGDSIFISE